VLLLSYSSPPPPLSRVTPYLLVAVCRLCFLGWYSFHLIFFLQAMFGATTIKQKPASKVSFFFSKKTHFLFEHFQKFFKKKSQFFVECDTIFFYKNFAGKRKKTKNCLKGK
jgi:hypothetical protein